MEDVYNSYEGRPGKDENNFLFFVNNNFSRYESNANTQAITAIASSGNEIRDTDIVVNDEAFDYYYDSKYNKEIVLAQNRMAGNRKIASSQSPGFWFKISEQFKQWMNFLLKPFKKKKAIRHIATPAPRVPKNKVDFPSLIIHELGHVPGLAHVNDDHPNFSHSSRKGRSKHGNYLSVMEPKLSTGRARRDITDHDLKSLFCGYFNY